MNENEKQRSRAIQHDRSAAFEEITRLSDPANNTICWQSAALLSGVCAFGNEFPW